MRKKKVSPLSEVTVSTEDCKSTSANSLVQLAFRELALRPDDAPDDGGRAKDLR